MTSSFGRLIRNVTHLYSGGPGLHHPDTCHVKTHQTNEVPGLTPFPVQKTCISNAQKTYDLIADVLQRGLLWNFLKSGNIRDLLPETGRSSTYVTIKGSPADFEALIGQINQHIKLYKDLPQTLSEEQIKNLETIRDQLPNSHFPSQIIGGITFQVVEPKKLKASDLEKMVPAFLAATEVKEEDLSDEEAKGSKTNKPTLSIPSILGYTLPFPRNAAVKMALPPPTSPNYIKCSVQDLMENNLANLMNTVLGIGEDKRNYLLQDTKQNLVDFTAHLEGLKKSSKGKENFEIRRAINYIIHEIRHLTLGPSNPNEGIEVLLYFDAVQDPEEMQEENNPPIGHSLALVSRPRWNPLLDPAFESICGVGRWLIPSAREFIAPIMAIPRYILNSASTERTLRLRNPSSTSLIVQPRFASSRRSTNPSHVDHSTLEDSPEAFAGEAFPPLGVEIDEDNRMITFNLNELDIPSLSQEALEILKSLVEGGLNPVITGGRLFLNPAMIHDDEIRFLALILDAWKPNFWTVNPLVSLWRYGKIYTTEGLIRAWIERGGLPTQKTSSATTRNTDYLSTFLDFFALSSLANLINAFFTPFQRAEQPREESTELSLRTVSASQTRFTEEAAPTEGDLEDVNALTIPTTSSPLNNATHFFRAAATISMQGLGALWQSGVIQEGVTLAARDIYNLSRVALTLARNYAHVVVNPCLRSTGMRALPLIQNSEDFSFQSDMGIPMQPSTFDSPESFPERPRRPPLTDDSAAKRTDTESLGSRTTRSTVSLDYPLLQKGIFLGKGLTVLGLGLATTVAVSLIKNRIFPHYTCDPEPLVPVISTITKKAVDMINNSQALKTIVSTATNATTEGLRTIVDSQVLTTNTSMASTAAVEHLGGIMGSQVLTTTGSIATNVTSIINPNTLSQLTGFQYPIAMVVTALAIYMLSSYFKDPEKAKKELPPLDTDTTEDFKKTKKIESAADEAKHAERAAAIGKSVLKPRFNEIDRVYQDFTGKSQEGTEKPKWRTQIQDVDPGIEATKKGSYNNMGELLEDDLAKRGPLYFEHSKERRKEEMGFSARNRNDYTMRSEFGETLQAELEITEENKAMLDTHHVFSHNSPLNGSSYKDSKGETVELNSATSSPRDRTVKTTQNLSVIKSAGTDKPISFTGRVDTLAKAEEQGFFILENILYPESGCKPGKKVIPVDSHAKTKTEYGDMEALAKAKGMRWDETSKTLTVDYTVTSLMSDGLTVEAANIIGQYLGKDIAQYLGKENREYARERMFIANEKKALEELKTKTYKVQDSEGNIFNVQFNPILFANSINCSQNHKPFAAEGSLNNQIAHEGWEKLKALIKLKKETLDKHTQTKLEHHEKILETHMTTWDPSERLSVAQELLHRDYIYKLMNIPIVYHCKSSTDRTSIASILSTALQQWIDLGHENKIPSMMKDLIADERFKELVACAWQAWIKRSEYSRDTEGLSIGSDNQVMVEILPDRYLKKIEYTAVGTLALGATGCVYIVTNFVIEIFTRIAKTALMFADPRFYASFFATRQYQKEWWNRNRQAVIDALTPAAIYPEKMIDKDAKFIQERHIFKQDWDKTVSPFTKEKEALHRI